MLCWWETWSKKLKIGPQSIIRVIALFGGGIEISCYWACSKWPAVWMGSPRRFQTPVTLVSQALCLVLHWIFLPCRPSHLNSFVHSELYTDKAKNYSIQQLIKQKSAVSLPWIFLQRYRDKNRCIIIFPLTNAMFLWRLFVLWDPTTNKK